MISHTAVFFAAMAPLLAFTASALLLSSLRKVLHRA